MIQEKYDGNYYPGAAKRGNVRPRGEKKTGEEGKLISTGMDGEEKR